MGKAGVPRLIELCGHEDNAVAVSAGVALSRMMIDRPVREIAAALTTAKDRKLERLCSAIWWMGPTARDAYGALLEVAANEIRPDDERVNAAWAATKVDPGGSREAKEIREIVPELIRVLDSGPFRMQGRAAEALGVIGPSAKSALPALRKRLELPRAEVDTEGLIREYVQREARKAIAAIEKNDE
jgi:hypothetical protein